ncbi:MAG: penicillin-binding protein 2 [Bacteroidetes bacterium]|nr:penicillin-binding protein 2 [Bacteroidota bacterium]
MYQFSAEFGSQERKRIFQRIIWIGFSVVIIRLFQLQYIYYEEFGKVSIENSIRTVIQEPIRGYIYDRNKNLIVSNKPSYTIMIVPADFNEKNIPLLAYILKIPESEVIESLRKAKIYNRFVPSRLKRDITYDQMVLLAEYLKKLPGIEVEAETKRSYVSESKISHALGYVKEISKRQLEKDDLFYRPGDMIGSNGIEAKYEEFLRGIKGYKYISQNSKGQNVGTFNEGKNDIDPIDGADLHLEIDINVQSLAESLLSIHRGAIVAIDPRNGGVIAFASKPDYDLTEFSGVTSSKVWNSLITDLKKPLFNRASMTKYPPGSTFKMIVAISALEKNIIDENWRVQCRGGFQFGNKYFKDLHVHGSTNIVEAIQRSCNVFFYQLMLKVGLDNWSFYGKEFGFGEQTGVDILEENPGLLPSTEYYNKTYGVGKWTQGYLISLGIGQGELGVSPIQMASYTSMLANKGKFIQPHILNYAYDRNKKNKSLTKFSNRQINVSEKTWDIVREGMRRVVMEPGGTASGARVKDVIVAGKTGTAQNPHGEDHSWFIGFAPFDNPQIAICVLVENVGSGGTYAAPFAGKCIDRFLHPINKSEKFEKQQIIKNENDSLKIISLQEGVID